MIDGTVATGFEQVRDVFRDVAAREPGLEAQLAVYRDGRLVWNAPGGEWMLTSKA